MKKISIVSVGGVKKRYYQEIIAEYQKRLSKDVKMELIELPNKSFNDKNHLEIKKQDSLKVLEFLNKNKEAKVFLLSENGEELDSVAFSKKIFSINEPIIFVIAGALGFDFSILKTYPKISLSKMTFLHEMAKVILLEQIYRSTCIFKGKSYHY